jgi:hypothetical protein
MEHCYEDTDYTWDADECQDVNCSAGNCKSIREQLIYQRKRNEYIRKLLISGLPSDKDTITAMIKQFRIDCFRKKTNQTL